MEKRSGGRRASRRRRSQKSTEGPGAPDDLPPEGAAREDALFDDEVAPDAAAEKKVKSPRAAAEGGAAAAGGPGARGQPRGDAERGRPVPPASSPTKRKARSRAPEPAPGGPRAPARESPPKRALDPGPGAKGAADGEEAARVIPRELTVRSSSLLPEIRPEHKRGPPPGHHEGRSRELGRPAAASEPRIHPGVGRSTVTTKVTLPARPKHVELNLKNHKNADGLGTEHSAFSQPVHKGNTATKISLFENKRVNSSPKHVDGRGPRNIPASSKTFVGRAKLNLAKKAKEMEQAEKKASSSSPQNGVSAKGAPAEATVPGPEETGPAAPGPSGEATLAPASGPPADPSDVAERHRDAGCPSASDATAPAPVLDLGLREEDADAADPKRLANGTHPAHSVPSHPETRDPPPQPQGTVCGSQPPAEPLGPADLPEGDCAGCPIGGSPSTDPPVSGSHSGCVLPASHHSEQVPLPVPDLGGREANLAVSPVAGEHEGPSKVLVQVRAFVLPVESARDLSAHVVPESSKVGEAQLPSCHSSGLEVVSVASCSPGQEEVGGRESPSPQHMGGEDEEVVSAGSHAAPPESEAAVGPQAPPHGGRTEAVAEASPSSPPGGGNRPEASPGPDQNGHTPASLLNVSAGSDDSVLDSSSDMEKFTEIIKKMDSAVCVPQKKRKARVPNCPTPHFAMPPIHEDSLEKVFDPNVFTIGLGKKDSQPETSAALQLMQSLDSRSKLRPKRASTERSVVFRSLHAHTNGNGVSPGAPEASDRESRDVPNGGGGGSVKRSRLEKSALFSSLLSSLPQDKVFSPSVTSVSSMTTSFSSSQDGSAAAQSPVGQPPAEGAPPGVADSEQPSLPPRSALKVFSFSSSGTPHSGLRSPSHPEKHLPDEGTAGVPNPSSHPHLPETKFPELSKWKNGDEMAKASHMESTLRPSVPNHGDSDTDFMSLFKPSRFDPGVAFSAMSLSDTPALRGNAQNKLNPRPGKVVIFSDPDAPEECIEVFGDLEDCTCWKLSPVVLIRVVRGCWILYEKPHFEGPSIPLEEGELELSGLWGAEGPGEESDETQPEQPVVIGSMRHVVQDYRISQIDLFTEPEGLGLLNSYFDDTEDMQGFGVMQKTCSIKVHWGTWLIYEEPGFQGVPFILEPGEYPDLSFWDTEEAYIGSMRPMKMGGRKVEFPTNPKAVVYEKPFFEGRSVELEAELCSISAEAGDTQDAAGDGPLRLASVGSLKVLRGIWVAYEQPGFAGHQYLLEEGEYREWRSWGGYSGDVGSLRPVLGDFSNPHMVMYSEKNFGSKGPSVDVLGIVADLKETGYGVMTRSINVLSGVWVAYENPDFTGEQYILDKGLYASCEDWGGKNCRISSVQPVCLDSFTGPRRRNQIHLFSEPQFQGQSQRFEETTRRVEGPFAVKSCRVLGGSCVAYDGDDFSGNQYVLEEGHYPCLSAMGCLPGATFRSLRFIDAEFSEPTIVLFERENFKGKKIELSAETVNLQSLGFNTQIRSVQVVGGIWITYEYGNYRGRQFLLSPVEVPNWYEFSGCRQIGSLRPFVQKQIYFRLRNKATGLFMSTNGNLEDLKLLRIQVMEDVGADDQVWIYQDGSIKSRIAEGCCLTIVGSLVTSGSKLGLALDQSADSQFWSMTSDGRIYSKLKPNLVLDVKGGSQYDRNHVILNTVSPEKPGQQWEAVLL
ncbi:beta/gamma crystallin domain-containing protein 1 [Ctenodactylus gundi]